MLRNVVRIGGAVGLAAGAWLAGTTGAAAQEQEGGGGGRCQLEGTEVTAQAEELIDQASKQDTIQGAEAAARAQFQQALKRVQLALQQDSADATAHWLAGRAHIGLDEYAKADSSLDRFVALQDDAAPCRELANTVRFQAWANMYNEGIRKYQQGQDSVALVHFEKANTIYEDARSLNNAALLRQRSGDVEEARRLYRRSMEIAEDEQQVRAAHINLAELLRNQGEREASLSVYRTYLAEHPGDVQAKINYAVGLRETGSPDSAQRVLESVMSRDDLSFKEWFDTGLTLMQMQSYQAAVAAFERARQAAPYDKATMQNLMSSYLGSGNFQRAAALGDTLVGWYPQQRSLYKSYMQALDKLGRTDRVQQLLPALQQLSVEISQSALVRQGENQYQVRGQVQGSSASGGSVILPIELFDQSGETVATKDATIQVPGRDRTTAFQVQIETDAPVAGFRYGEIRQGS